jgi:hypothetical protein
VLSWGLINSSFFTLFHLTFSFFIMTKETAIGMLRVAQTGNEMLQVLDSLTSGFSYIESPQIEQVLGVATLEPIEFWLWTIGG